MATSLRPTPSNRGMEVLAGRESKLEHLFLPDENPLLPLRLMLGIARLLEHHKPWQRAINKTLAFSHILWQHHLKPGPGPAARVANDHQEYCRSRTVTTMTLAKLRTMTRRMGQ